MITERTTTIDAPAREVWGVLVDVRRWPDWTDSVERVVPLGDPAVAPGNLFRVEQPWFPPLTWEVTGVSSGTSWTWRQESLGSTTCATHEVLPLGPTRTLVRLRIDQGGPLGAVVALATRGLTRRYLAMEAEGLKARSEQRHLARPPGWRAEEV